MNRRHWTRALVTCVAVALLLPPGAAGAADPAPAVAEPQQDPASVPEGDRAAVLGEGWASSEDRAWAGVGDASGFHVLVADAATGYTWRTAATLGEPGVAVDQWIGQACVTGSGRRAVVVYAPRAFANRPRLFDAGAFAAVVDLDSGAVTKLRERVSLAYFNPGCGTGERAVLTQAADETEGLTRLLTLDAEAGTIGAPVTVQGQVTSAVPLGDSIVAARRAELVGIAADGRTSTIATTSGVPFRLTPTAGGAVLFLDAESDGVRVRSAEAGQVREVARGALDEVSLAAGAGRAFLLGGAQVVGELPAGTAVLDVPADARVSTLGELAVTAALPEGLVERLRSATAPEPGLPQPISIDALVSDTGAPLAFRVDPLARVADGYGTGADPSPALATAAPPGARTAPPSAVAADGTALADPSVTGSPTDPVDADRRCAVPRNDVRSQVYQPTARQVEWAANLAVQGALTVQRPVDWNESGLPAYSPQGMFPRIGLAGGGRVPAQILLGILAAESNLWQASGRVVEGVSGNPLVGDFYGYEGADNPDEELFVNWAGADCGYGIAQVTDGMRLNDRARTYTEQRTIALDYAANIAAGLRILEDKWNQTYGGGLRVHDADPSELENWYFAVWAYNSGYYPNQGNGEPWGVGWHNNPSNPKYPPNRTPFQGDGADAAHPADWPYQERVLGFAAYPIIKSDRAAYLQAAWLLDEWRDTVKPPALLFCRPSNSCETGVGDPNLPNVPPPGNCTRADSRCWFHEPVSWKTDCDRSCGFEQLRFSPGAAEPPDGTRYPPACTDSDLPLDALVIDDIPTSAPRLRCASATSNGTFALRFAAEDDGTFASKIDFHQIGAGFGDHFWFAHTRRNVPEDERFEVTGTWTLDRQVNGWARVLVHMPDHGAHTQQARYTVNRGGGRPPVRRALLQRTQANRWVPLGTFEFSGTPSVSLSTVTEDGEGVENVAWDAIAIQPLPAKPDNFVVAMGDSYSSGEGVSPVDGSLYYRETNNNGTNEFRNACHRSPQAWARLGVLRDSTATIGARANAYDPELDFHFVACSGAQTENILPTDPFTPNYFGEDPVGQYGTLTQIDAGFLDANTTLVTLNIGGNDAGFGDVLKTCLLSLNCPEELNLDLQTLDDATRQRIRGPVRASISLVLDRIHEAAPNARIVLLGYPELFTDNCHGNCSESFTEGETDWMNEMSGVLNENMAGAAAAAAAEGLPVSFSDPRDDFRGRAIGDPDPALHAFVWTQTAGDVEITEGVHPPSQQSFHPNLSGTHLYAEALQRVLDALDL